MVFRVISGLKPLVLLLSGTATPPSLARRDQGVLATREDALVVQGDHKERHAGPVTFG